MQYSGSAKGFGAFAEVVYIVPVRAIDGLGLPPPAYRTRVADGRFGNGAR